MYMFSSWFYNNHVKQITKFSQIHNQPIKWDEKQITASSPVLIAHDLASTKDQKISSKTEIYPLNGNRGTCVFLVLINGEVRGCSRIELWSFSQISRDKETKVADYFAFWRLCSLESNFYSGCAWESCNPWFFFW